MNPIRRILIGAIVVLAFVPGATAQLAPDAGPSERSRAAPPSKPSGLTVVSRTSSSLRIRWKPSAGGVSYGVYLGTKRVSSTTARTYTFTRLTCARSYRMGVDAVRAAKRSAKAWVSATTLAVSPTSKSSKRRGCPSPPPPGGSFSCYGPATAGCWTPSACTVVIASGDTTGLQNAVNAAADGAVICGNGSYGTLTISNKSHSSDVTVQSQNPNSAMTIASLKVTASNHWKLQGLHLNAVQVLGNDNITLRQNIHTDGQMFLAPTTSCYPDGPTFHANANVVIDHSEFTHYNETNGGQEGRLTVCGQQRTSGGFKITNNWFHGGWAGSAAASSCSDGIDGYGDPYGVLIQGNEFSEMDQGACVSAFPAIDPHVDPIAPNGINHSQIVGNWFHDNGGSGGIMGGPDDGNQVIGNVFDGRGYPYSIVAFSVHNWVIQHNTFYADPGIQGGQINFEDNGNGLPSGNLVRDNVFMPRGGISAISTSTWGTSDHNLNVNRSGTGNITGTPVFVGGANPQTFDDYRLAPGSPGKGAASDGTDMGISG